MLKQQRGFSLVELMVGLVIGLLIVGGVVAVFISNQHTAATKRDYDNAQEAFRFSSYTISRLVRNAAAISVSGDDLVITFTGGPGVLNCIGAPTVPGATIINTLRLNGDRLECEHDGGVDILVRGIASLAFTEVDDSFNNLSSVMTTLAMTSGLSSTITASARNMLIAQYSGGSARE